jgi:hypothetical protein
MKLTLNDIKSKSPCENGYKKLLKSFDKTSADDTEVSIQHLLNSNGIDNTLWVIYNCIPDRIMDKRNMCADFAESVLHIFEEQYPNDKRPRQAIEICRKENATKEEIEAAGAAAMCAAWVARDAGAAAWDAGVVWAAWNAAWVARVAAGVAAGDSAWVDRVAGDVWAAAGDAARDAAVVAGDDARNAELEKQKEIIIKYFG